MTSDTSVTRFDPASDQSGLDAVLAAVSGFKRTDETELRCLDRYIDDNAINSLFGGPTSSTTRILEGALSFRYDDVFVTVTHDGWIEVVDADAVHARPASRGLSVDAREQRSPEVARNAAAAALTEAEEHIWTAASTTSDNELVDPLWTAIEQLWDIQRSLGDMTFRSSSTESPATRTDDRR